jgi:outer membrane protein assembly factor BamA
LGSDFEYVKFDLDIRHYLRPFKKHVLAAQFFFENNWGTPSFENLALLGGDEVMRGHYLGRFRDNSYYAAQVEYRLPLVRSHWNDEREKVPFIERWGLVGFAGFGRVADKITDLGFKNAKKSLGLGIRYLAIPKERINIRLDIGFGTQNPGFYVNIRESF